MENELYILWHSDNIITAQKTVFMYAINAKKKNWWNSITIIIWGASQQLAERNPTIQKLIIKAIKEGVIVTACQACADQLDASDKLEELGVELKYWGEPLTELLKANKKILSI